MRDMLSEIAAELKEFEIESEWLTDADGNEYSQPNVERSLTHIMWRFGEIIEKHVKLSEKDRADK